MNENLDINQLRAVVSLGITAQQHRFQEEKDIRPIESKIDELITSGITAAFRYLYNQK